MSRADTIRFRHHQAVLVAAVIATIGALPLAAARTYLLPVLLVPLVVAAWAWRSGTDADRRELRVRALVGSRRVPWEQVVELTADPRGRAVVRLADGQQLPLPAVQGVDLPRLVSITGQALPDPR
ncbi:PH domain-containing protein [Micromonospora rifamycinica]|uniref:PH domain-containing protein n=1 Tax=Micromonospora rifamycinica TaxID=291594 RepID=UPI0033CCCF82